MPLLWELVQLFPSEYLAPVLSKLPGTPAEHALAYISSLSLGLSLEKEDFEKRDCDAHCEYLNQCHGIILGAKSLRTVRVFPEFYDTNNYLPNIRRALEAINRATRRILKHIVNLELQELHLSLDRDISVFGLRSAMTILAPKVTSLKISGKLCLEAWIDRLPHFSKSDLHPDIAARRRF